MLLCAGVLIMSDTKNAKIYIHIYLKYNLHAVNINHTFVKYTML